MKTFNEKKLELIEELAYIVNLICQIGHGEKGNIDSQAEYLRESAKKLENLSNY